MLSGVLFLVITGLLWVIAAAVIRHALSQRANIIFIAGFAAMVCMICCLPVMAVLEKPSFPWAVHMLVFVALFLAGLLATATLYAVNKVRHARKTGMVWYVIHLGCVAPFIMGTVLFDEPATPARLIGLLLVLAAMVMLGSKLPEARLGEERSKAWKPAALIGFGASALAQCAFAMPSYLHEAELVTGSFRMFYFCAGVLAGALLLILRWRSLLDSRKCFVPAMLLAFITMIVCGFFVFNGINRLAAAKCGGIAFPLITGSCIAGFYLFRCFVLKEKLHHIQSAGFILGAAGLIAICL